MDYLALLWKILWIVVQILIWVGIGWLLVPKIFKYIIAPNFDGTYHPKKDPMPQNIQLTEQDNDARVDINSETGSYAIRFGERRDFDDGIVELFFDGRWYSSDPSKSKEYRKANYLPLRFLGSSAQSGSDFRGPVQIYSMKWAIEGSDPVLETSILKHAETHSLVFKTVFLKENPKSSIGNYQEPMCAFPCFKNNSHNLRIFTYRDMIFSPPMREFDSVFAPVLFFDDTYNSVMFSSLNHFIQAQTHRKANEDGVFRYYFGFEGELKSIPKDTELSAIMMFGSGIYEHFMKWGDMLRKYYGKRVDMKHHDIVNEKLGYFTDNGGYYYYNPLKGKDYSATLIAVHEDATKNGIPLCYYNLDSWWYQKSVQKWKRALLGDLGRILGGGLYGGTLLWETDTEVLKMTPKELGERLNVVFTAHNRWVSNKSPYVERYKSVIEGTKALPIEKGYWDEIMTTAQNNRIVCYEQDWMTNHLRGISYLREQLDAPREWLKQMAEAAAERNISIMYCMATPAQWMQSIEFDNVVVTRASGDYNPRWPRVYDTPPFTQASILAHALGLRPFKDVFMSTCTGPINGEKQPELMALISALSCGPVGFGDAIGKMSKTLAMACARKDGTLIQPDRPMVPVDLMFIRHRKYYILHTLSLHNEISKTWHYITVLNLWPSRVKENFFTLREIGQTGDYLAFDYYKHTIQYVTTPDVKITQKLADHKYKYMILAPNLGVDFYFIGDASRFAAASPQIIQNIAIDQAKKSLNISLVAMEEDESSLLFYVPMGSDKQIKIRLENPADADLDLETGSDGFVKVRLHYRTSNIVKITAWLE
jgi:hypothetical protein